MEPPQVVVLVAAERGRQWVACACERAEAQGVRVGMSSAHAKALLKGTLIREKPFMPVEDAQKLRGLARWAQRFTPMVSVDEPDGLLLDMAGCEKLYGGDERMVTMIDESLRRLKLEVRLALAPTVGCAWAAARFKEDRVSIVRPECVRQELASLPVAGLRIDPMFVEALGEVGVERIGELFELPRPELVCRFGPDLLRRLDQAMGEVEEQITPLRDPPPIEATRNFDGPVTSLEAILMTARELLFAVVVQLEERGCGARTLNVALNRISAEPVRLTIALTHPNRDGRHLWTLLRSKLERANLGYGVESVTLHVSRWGKLPPRQIGLDGVEAEGQSRANEAVWGEFLDRLMDRFGSRAVRAMTVTETHVPEDAFSLRAWSETHKRFRRRSEVQEGSGSEIRAAEGMTLRDRPSQLFEVPESAQVISLVPDGPPSWLHWRGREYSVHRTSGPERLALPWWKANHGNAPSANVVRDYYEVEDDQGRLLWMFRDRATNGWFVHGLWA